MDKPKKFKLQPDIVINNGKIIMDTKWKLLDLQKENQNISQADIYQMFAYASKYENCEKVFLIYPHVKGVELIDEYTTKICNREVKVKPLFFDLNNDEFKLDSKQIHNSTLLCN